MATSPVSLVRDGILTTSHLYRTAKVNVRELDLCTANAKDDFPELVEDPNKPGQLQLPNCMKSLEKGDMLTFDQWPTLTTWYAGLSCQTHLKVPPQGMLLDEFDVDFLHEFQNAKGTIKVSSGEKYQQFLCYKLRRGTHIPVGVGIVQDGDNHVSMYPIGEVCAVSNVSFGQVTFEIDALRDMLPLWKPFAVLKVKACGYEWPMLFPPDSDLFPFRSWVKAVVLAGEAELAVSLAYAVEDYIEGIISWVKLFEIALSVGLRFGLMCSYEECLLNLKLTAAVRFALQANEISQQNRNSLAAEFWLFAPFCQ